MASVRSLIRVASALAPLLLVGLFQSAAVHAEIYRWVDEQGKTHFSDKPPVMTDAEPLDLRINTYTAVTHETSSVDVGERVIMYSTGWCGYCKKARRYFRANRISFTEYDIEKSPSARRKFDQLEGRGVPLILVGNRRMNGFSESGFSAIYHPR